MNLPDVIRRHKRQVRIISMRSEDELKDEELTERIKGGVKDGKL